MFTYLQDDDDSSNKTILEGRLDRGRGQLVVVLLFSLGFFFFFFIYIFMNGILGVFTPKNPKIRLNWNKWRLEGSRFLDVQLDMDSAEW